MAGYTRLWDCEKCGERQESIDWPDNCLCDRCDDKTKLRCLVCGQQTNVTPKELMKAHAYGLVSGRVRAVHDTCVLIDESDA
jgi:transcription elongation factor Elf1